MLLVPVALTASIAGLLLAPFYLIPTMVGCRLLATCLICAFLLGRRRAIQLFVFLVFFLLANLRYPHQFPADPRVEHVAGIAAKVTMVAELQQVTQRVDSRSQLDLKLIRVEGENSKEGSGRIRLYVDEAVSGLLPGDLLVFSTRLRKPRLFGTPGEFHWPRHLASQGIVATGWLKKAEQISLLQRGGYSPLRSIAVWKERAAARIEQAVSGRQALLARALLLGEARILPDNVRECLAQAGISHLFAISGLHLGLIGLFGYRLLFCFYRRSEKLLNWQPPQRVLPLLVLPVLLGYLLMTGDAVSTRRAFCVASFAALFWLWRYTVNPLRLLLYLALLFLLLNPLLLWQPSWQLSFSGAAGILLWQPLWQQKAEQLPRWLRAPARLLLVTVAATLATLPLVLLNFHLLPTAGLLVNLLAVPLVALCALPFGVCGLLIPVSPLDGWCFSVTGHLLEFVLGLTDKLLSVPGFSAHYLFLSRWQYLAVTLLVLPLLFCAQAKLRGRLPMIAVSCFGMSLLCGFVFVGRPADMTLYMVSVGQGESILLVDAEKRAILIDGGGLYSDRFDVGERLLAPALGELGVRRLSAVLLTHDHPDHRKGLLFVMQHFPVDEFWAVEDNSELDPRLQEVLAERKISFRRFGAGWTEVESRPDRQLKLFHYVTRNKNDSSLVLYLQQQGRGLLLTGDLEAKGVQRLLEAGLPGPVDLLKVPHHGSRFSSTDDLLKQLQPQLCLVSAGYGNRYRFPARQVVEAHRKLNIPLYRTDLSGTLMARLRGGEWRVESWQDGLFR